MCPKDSLTGDRVRPIWIGLAQGETMDRREQQTHLIFELGLLLSPLYHVADRLEGRDAEFRAKARARFFSEVERLETEVRSFVRAEPGHDYRIEWNDIHQAFHTLKSGIGETWNTPDRLSALLDQKAAEIRQGILSIPVSTNAAILDALTPFSTHCIVYDLCQGASDRVMWVDRYFDGALFHRYLRNVRRTVNVTLVTWPASKKLSKRASREFNEFLDISKLYAQERGPTDYRLVTHTAAHDRWLCCDSEIYQLGGSIKDIGKQASFTLSKVDPTPTNFQQIERLAKGGTELFGPAQTTHP